MGKNSKRKRDKRKSNSKAPKVQIKKAQNFRPTLGLAMIMKDEVEDLDRIVKDYGKFFDKIYVTVTHQETYEALLKRFPENSATAGLVELSYFKWIDHFGKARLYSQQQIKTDYWMWLDLDDEIENAGSLRHVIEYMVANDLNAVWFRYDTVRLSTWRERIIKTSSRLEWKDEAIHETITAQRDTKEQLLSDVIIKHRKTVEQSQAAIERNKLILEKEWHQTQRPVTAYYLGVLLRELGDYESAIEKLSFAAQHGESDVQRIAALHNLCECYKQTGRYDMALDATGEAIAIKPDHPLFWYEKFLVYREMGDLNAALDSAEVAMSKRAGGELTILLDQDPAWYLYKAPFEVAKAYLSTGNVERAYQLYSEVNKTAPQYIEERSTAAEVQWSAVFEQAYNDMLAVD